jgi:hypothetical protein
MPTCAGPKLAVLLTPIVYLRIFYMPKVGNAVSIIEVLFSILAPRNKQEVAVRDDKNLEKTWREIAAKVSMEPDSDKVAELSQELIKALDKDSKEKLERVTKTKRRRSA